MICLNGAAARQVAVGDHVILMCYAQMTPEEAKEHHPKVVLSMRIITLHGSLTMKNTEN